VSGRLVLSTHGDRDGESVVDALALRDNEGAVIELGSS
jgi:alpha-glucosidase